MADKKPKLIIRGTFVWPKLDEPDTFQPKDRKGNPKGNPSVRYITNFKPVNDAEMARVKAEVEKIAKADGLEGVDYKKPWRVNKKDGEELLEAKRAVKLGPPPVFGAKGSKLPKGIKIGGGSEGKIEVSVNVYEMSDGTPGVNFYLDSVQLVKFVEKGVYRNPFEVEEDGYDGEEATSGDDASSEDTSTKDDLDDEIPF